MQAAAGVKILKRLVPRAAKRLARSVMGDVRLRRVSRKYRRLHGPQFVTEIHPNDEMFRFMQNSHPTRAEAAASYLRSGDEILRNLDEFLADAGGSLDAVSSFLDFACGYGRLTRFLVHRVPPTRITVSDINSAAVDFSRKTFGVNGFYSTALPQDLSHQLTYDVIFVSSLFSHLSLSVWGGWLKRLHAMLNAQGLLIISTHGMTRYEEGGRNATELEAGFYFFPANETHGRLATDYYGTTYVTEAYVRHFVSSERIGEVVRFYPDGLRQLQDVYVIRNDPATRSTPTPSPNNRMPAHNA